MNHHAHGKKKENACQQARNHTQSAGVQRGQEGPDDARQAWRGQVGCCKAKECSRDFLEPTRRGADAPNSTVPDWRFYGAGALKTAIHAFGSGPPRWCRNCANSAAVASATDSTSFVAARVPHRRTSICLPSDHFSQTFAEEKHEPELNVRRGGREVVDVVARVPPQLNSCGLLTYKQDFNNTQDTVSEWLRRWTRNLLGSARRGSNPLGVACGNFRNGKRQHGNATFARHIPQ